MKFLSNLLIGGLGTFLGLKTLNVDELPTGGTIEELVEYLVAIFGGILSALIINFLKKKFPDLWAKMSAKKK
jgi:ABC-type Co2+ transport system permease subunit